MYTIERKVEIINMLEKYSKVHVNELAEILNTSKETIRRDLKGLEDDGVIKRTHGGAVLNTTRKEEEYPLVVREIQRYEEKNIICKKAAEFIYDGDTIFIDNSSTTQNLIKYINKSIHITIITNSIQLLLESINNNNNNISIICLGGIFRSKNLSTYGSISQENTKYFYPDKTFISCKGIDRKAKLTDGSIYEVDTKKIILDKSKEIYILADYTKFSVVGQIHLSDFSCVNTIITDDKTDVQSLDYLSGYNLNLITAKKDKTEAF